MRDSRWWISSLVVAGAARALPAQGTPSRVHEESPALSSGLGAEEQAALRATRGVWPIANGRVFTYTGLGEPANRIFMITGPHYQTEGNHNPHGAFGEQWIEVACDDQILVASSQRWAGIEDVAGGTTVERFDQGVELRTTSVALPDRPVVLRRIELTPGSRTGRWKLSIRFSDTPSGEAIADGRQLREAYRRGDRTHRLLATVLDPEPEPIAVTARAGRIDLDLGEHLGESALTLALVTSTTAEEESDSLAAIRAEGGAAALRRSVATHQRTLSDTIRATPHGPIRDCLEAVKVLILSQRSRPGGGVAPMVNFKGVWLRDSNGPLRSMLWMGKFEEARALLRYYRAASALAGATHREFPLDLPVERAPTLSAEQWARTGTDRCEVPSFVVLQHLWYWNVTGDAALIREHYDYLRRNALHQQREEGVHGPLQPFNGDETYLHGAFYSLFPGRGVWPNQFPSASAWSLDSMLTFVACQSAMVELCEVAGHPEHAAGYEALGAEMRASVEAHFWQRDRGYYAPALSRVTQAPHQAPYAPINLSPLWLGTHGADDPRARANLQAVIALLGREDGLLRMTPSVDRYIGSLPGYYLVNLAAVDHPLAWKTLAALLESCSVSGEWTEVHEADGLGHGYGDGRYANRFRPWESGLNMDAVLRFLTGARFSAGTSVRLSPRRPAHCALRTVGPIRVGDTRFELVYPDDDEDPVRVVHLQGPGCMVDDQRLEPGGHLHVPLRRPASIEIPPPRAFEAELEAPQDRPRLLLTSDPAVTHDPETDHVLDVGLPFSPASLARLLFRSDGARRFEVVILDPSSRRADRQTMKPEAFWQDPVLLDAWNRFEETGGRVEGLPENAPDRGSIPSLDPAPEGGTR